MTVAGFSVAPEHPYDRSTRAKYRSGPFASDPDAAAGIIRRSPGETESERQSGNCACRTRLCAQTGAHRQARTTYARPAGPVFTAGFHGRSDDDRADSRSHRRHATAGPHCCPRLPGDFRRPSTGRRNPSQLLALLLAIEKAPYDVQVHHLQMKPKYDNPVNLDATLKIVTYVKA